MAFASHEEAQDNILECEERLFNWKIVILGIDTHLLVSVYTFVAGEQEVNILAEILDNSADVFEDLAKEIGSEDIIGKYTDCCFIYF